MTAVAAQEVISVHSGGSGLAAARVILDGGWLQDIVGQTSVTLGRRSIARANNFD